MRGEACCVYVQDPFIFRKNCFYAGQTARDGIGMYVFLKFIFFYRHEASVPGECNYGYVPLILETTIMFRPETLGTAK